MQHNSLVALDLGAQVGVTIARRGSAPIFDTFALNGASRGYRFADLSDRLIERLKLENIAGRIEMGCYEAALPAGNAARSMDVVQVMFGYAAHAESAFARLGMPYHSEHLSTMRKHVTGRGRFDSGEAKPEVLRHVRDVMGLDVTDYNVADSVIVAEWFANCASWSLLDFDR